MPELKEVFDMVSQKVEPDADAWRQQNERHRRSARNRKIGAFAVVAALLTVAVIVAITLPREEAAPDKVGNNPPPSEPSEPGTYFVDLATGETTLVPGIDPAGSSFDVSRDGTRMTFSADDGAVHVADVDGSNDRALEQTVATGNSMGPRWSPDGSTIVYQGGRTEGGRIGNIFVVDVTTGVTTRITDLNVVTSGFYYMAPTFTPDGTSILFTMPTDTSTQRWNLWSVPATGGDPTLVRRNAGSADFSPVGALLYVGIRSDPTNLPIFDGLFVSEDGIGRERLVDGELFSPRWSPYGSMIAYAVAGEIRVVDVSTGQTSVAFGREQFPEWVDDDTLILDLTTD